MAKYYKKPQRNLNQPKNYAVVIEGDEGSELIELRDIEQVRVDNGFLEFWDKTDNSRDLRAAFNTNIVEQYYQLEAAEEETKPLPE